MQPGTYSTPLENSLFKAEAMSNIKQENKPRVTAHSIILKVKVLDLQMHRGAFQIHVRIVMTKS